MQTRPFLKVLSVLTFGLIAAPHVSLPATGSNTNTTFHAAQPYRSRGLSPKFGAHFRSKRGRIIQSHHNPKFRKKLRYAHA